MTRLEEVENCEKAAKNYSDGEFDLYDAEMGWKDWMSEYASNDDDITATEHEDIMSVQAEAWNNIHPNDQISDTDIKIRIAKYS